jgi:hypothetical protein
MTFPLFVYMSASVVGLNCFYAMNKSEWAQHMKYTRVEKKTHQICGLTQHQK